MVDNPQPPPNAPVFRVEKLYLKDLSFENPNTPEVFLERQEPHVEMQMDSTMNPKQEGLYEVILEMTIKVNLEEKVLFLAQVAYGGLFRIQNVPHEHIGPLLGVECPSIIFPYLRQVVSQVVAEGGFKPMFLDPINFAAYYQQRQMQQAKGQA